MALEYSYSWFSNPNMIPDDVKNTLHIVTSNDTPLLALLPIRPVSSKLYEWFLYDIPNPTSVPSPEAEATVTPTTKINPYRASSLVAKVTRDYAVTETDRAIAKYTMDDRYAFRASEQELLLAKDFEAHLTWGAYTDWTSNEAVQSGAGLIQVVGLTGGEREQATATTTLGGNSTFPLRYYSSFHDCGATALSEAVFNTQLGEAYELGVPIDDLVFFAGQKVKRQLSEFNLVYNQGSSSNTELSESINRTHQREIKTRQISMDYYESDMGAFGVVINRYFNSNFSYTIDPTGTSSLNTVARGDTLLLGFDPSYFAMAQLRGIQSRDLAPTDDSQKGYVVAELGLEYGNPKAAILFANCGGENL